ncbi:MAG: proline--tRNA ligase [Lentisphaeraceae bacterium]|nr:proline--tRNA ligase [Lentisphaeraceae bacterium]
MKLSKLIGQRIKETPKDAQSASHIFLIRGGYIRPLSTGIYTLLPLAKRIVTKIENIIREEMNMIEGQEISMPLVNPADIWEESGRYQSVDQTLLKFKDRNNKDMVLAMTHEEAVCHMARTEITSYKQMPSMVFQIQTKYRDEARARAGLIRVREFTMKDGYSFHTSDECLAAYYEKAHQAYENIFKRIGMKDVLSIEADAGMIGGSVSHEFMAISDIGEDTIIASPCRKYLANREIATSPYKLKNEAPLAIEKVETPNTESIEDVAKLLGVETSETCKAVLYQSNDIDELIFVIVRGDIEVNEVKVKNHLKINTLFPAEDDKIKACGAVPGYASPIGVNLENVKLLVDKTVKGSSNLVAGANEAGYHLKNFNFDRDCGEIGEVLDIATVRAGDPCPVTGTALEEIRGIEVGNIFQLGTKYSEAMNVKYLDKNGKSKTAIMGCYGIGVGRALASVCEQSNDKWGPVWPLAIAPYHLHIIGLNMKKSEAVREKAEELYSELTKAGIEVIYDDRDAKAGFAFNDADLIGVPYRVVVSPKTLDQNSIEFKTRDGSTKEMINADSAVEYLKKLITEKLSEV